jgi:hypothetical protein
MINLLPPQARLRARSAYRRRTASVAFLGCVAVLLVGTGLLLPAYFFAQAAQRSVDVQAQALSATLAQKGLTDIGNSEQAAEGLYGAVKQMSAQARPSAAVDAVFSASNGGISLTRVEASGTSTLSVELSGTAATRTDLLAFKDALAGLAGVSDVNLPLGALVSSSKVPFSMTLDIAPAAASSSSS